MFDLNFLGTHIDALILFYRITVCQRDRKLSLIKTVATKL
jgi:hypothetical protein